MSPDKICETDKTIRTSKSVEDLAKIMRDNKPLFRYFLDAPEGLTK